MSQRNIAAIQTINDYGPHYLNPFIGDTAAETCANVQDAMGMLYRFLSKDDDFTEIQPALALIAQTVWSAVQFEGNLAEE